MDGFEGRCDESRLAGNPDLPLTEAEALKIRHDIAIGLDPWERRFQEREELTLGNLATLYIESHSKEHKRSWKDDERRVRIHFRPIAGLRLSAINRETVSRWHQRIAEERGKFQANRCLALFSSIFGWANRLGRWEGDNPAKGVQRFSEEKRERFLNGEELSRLWQALDAEPNLYWRAFFKLDLLLGLRKSELLTARWENIDLTAMVWRIPITKSGKPHTLPIPTPVLLILEYLPSRHRGGWVFPSEKHHGQRLSRADDAWERIRRRAELNDVRIHDLRRTCGSWLACSGYSLSLIGKVLNHSQPTTTAIYAKLTLDPVRLALERTAGLMMKSTKLEESPWK